MSDETNVAEPSGASGGSPPNYSAIPNSCLRGSTVEQRFCEPPVAGSTPAAGLYAQWIPVTERLPEEGRLVLWYRPDERWPVTSGRFERPHHVDWGGDLCVPLGEGRYTHWMPLPAPPTDAK